MPFPNEHGARLRNPSDFDPKTFRRTDGGTIYGKIKVPKTIGIIWGKLKTANKPSDSPLPQALRFGKESWTADEAKKWLRENSIKYILFEPAAEGKSEAAILELEEPRIFKNVRREKVFIGDAETKAFDEHKEDGKFGGGWITGYAATWDLDRYNEKFNRGAFAKSIRESVAAGKVPLMVKHVAHGGDIAEMVGEVSEMREDPKGLWYRADFFDDTFSQAARKKALLKKIPSNSIGFIPLSWKIVKDDDGRINHTEFIEAKIADVTLTMKPVNPRAIFLSAKSLDEITETADRVQKGEATPEDKQALQQVAESLQFTSECLVNLLAKPAEVAGKEEGNGTENVAVPESKPVEVSPRERRKRELERLRLSV